MWNFGALLSSSGDSVESVTGVSNGVNVVRKFPTLEQPETVPDIGRRV